MKSTRIKGVLPSNVNIEDNILIMGYNRDNISYNTKSNSRAKRKPKAHLSLRKRAFKPDSISKRPPVSLEVQICHKYKNIPTSSRIYNYNRILKYLAQSPQPILNIGGVHE